ncbi:MAG TPA: hypothetical protein GX007_01995 [Bacteroidales bacterium]|jgi:hypothetical protein|nr:hypothetical protein [Bacteroidales bacterium]
MKKIFVNLFFVILVTFQFVYSQDIKVVQSQNGESFLYDISYAKWNNWGSVVFDTAYRNNKTVVFDSDSLIKYEIPQSFKNRSSHLFLSNDGDYVINIYDGYGNANPNSVEIFEKGVLKYSYRVDELIDIDTNWDTRLLFSAYIGAVLRYGSPTLIFDTNTTKFEKKITQTPCYIDQDTIFLFTQTKELLLLDFKSGKIKKESFNYINEERLAQLHPASSFKPDLKKEKDDLKLVGDIDFEQTCANYFGMNIDKEKYPHYYQTYSINYGLLVDSKGKAIIGKLGYIRLSDTNKIVSFIDSIRFIPPSLPKGVDYYLIEKNVDLISKDLEQARIDRIRYEEEHIKRMEDSIRD